MMSYLFTGMHDPGIIWSSPDHIHSEDLEINEDSVYCSVCGIYRPFNSNHCVQCNACIQEYTFLQCLIYRIDHHCSLIGYSHCQLVYDQNLYREKQPCFILSLRSFSHHKFTLRLSKYLSSLLCLLTNTIIIQLRINNAISDIFTSCLTLTNNTENLTLLSTEITSNWISLLDLRKLTLL